MKHKREIVGAAVGAGGAWMVAKSALDDAKAGKLPADSWKKFFLKNPQPPTGPEIDMVKTLGAGAAVGALGAMATRGVV
jgi:hypothetical protein